MIKNEKIDLTILLIASLILSLYLFFRTYVISMDGAFQYVPMAKYLASGLFGKGLREFGQQPLYPFLVALFSRWVADYEIAGKLVSTLFGILMIFPVYFLGKRIFDQKVAFLSTLALTIHPYIRRFSADVLKESAYLFFLATAFWFIWRTLQKEKRYPFLFVPLFSALAYLVRPDGVEILLVAFFYTLFVKRFSLPGKKGVVILLIVVSSAVLFLPYLLHLKGVTGGWALSKAKGLGAMLGIGVVSSEVPLIHKILFSLKKLNFEIVAIFHPLYILLLLIGVWKRVFSPPKTGEGFLFLFCILHYIILFLLILNFTNWGVGEKEQIFLFSGRHVLPILLVSIYWVGAGIITIYDWILEKVASHHVFLGLRTQKESAIVWVTVLILILAIVLPKTLKPQRYERLPEKWSGIWIRNQSGQGATIFTDIPRVAYYAGGKGVSVDFERESIDQIKTSMVEKNALYLVIEERSTVHVPEKTEAIRKNFFEAFRYGEKKMENVIIYMRLQ